LLKNGAFLVLTLLVATGCNKGKLQVDGSNNSNNVSDNQQNVNGANGANGATGAQGPIGPQGPAGPQGPMGPMGPMGLTGLTGAQGPIGIQGPPGSATIPNIGCPPGLYLTGIVNATAVCAPIVTEFKSGQFDAQGHVETEIADATWKLCFSVGSAGVGSAEWVKIFRAANGTWRAHGGAVGWVGRVYYMCAK